MSSTVTIEIPAECEQFVRQCLALQEEMNTLALTAPHGAVLDVCEAAIVRKGRDFSRKVLEEAVSKRIESAEKKGVRSGVVAAVGPKRIGVDRRANS